MFQLLHSELSRGASHCHWAQWQGLVKTLFLFVIHLLLRIWISVNFFMVYTLLYQLAIFPNYSCVCNTNHTILGDMPNFYQKLVCITTHAMPCHFNIKDKEGWNTEHTNSLLMWKWPHSWLWSNKGRFKTRLEL